MVKNHLKFMLGKKFQRMIFQKMLTGEIRMVSTISHGTRTNISQFTVDHAGLKELPQLLLIDSTFSLETRIQLQLLLMLKQLLTAELEVHAKEVIQEVYMNSLPKKVFQIHHASNMSPLTSISQNVRLLINVKIAHGHHVQLVKLAKISVGLLITSTIMFQTIIP